MGKLATRNKWNSVGKDVVVLHGLWKGRKSAQLSPFVLKVETYLRMAGLKYVFDAEVPFGPKGKTPWITLNGVDIPDSEFIIQHLSSKFNKNFSSLLSQEQLAFSRAFTAMVDEQLFWGLVYWRFAKGTKKLRELLYIPWYIHFIGPISARNNLWHQGFGRHSEDEKIRIIDSGLEAISRYLGEKAFFMGKEPCEVDCTIFGTLAQYLWLLPEVHFAAIMNKKYKNLAAYCERMKHTFFPDWENVGCRWSPASVTIR